MITEQLIQQMEQVLAYKLIQETIQVQLITMLILLGINQVH